jgi:hypothetical protein
VPSCKQTNIYNKMANFKIILILSAFLTSINSAPIASCISPSLGSPKDHYRNIFSGDILENPVPKLCSI